MRLPESIPPWWWPHGRKHDRRSAVRPESSSGPRPVVPHGWPCLPSTAPPVLRTILEGDDDEPATSGIIGARREAVTPRAPASRTRRVPSRDGVRRHAPRLHPRGAPERDGGEHPSRLVPPHRRDAGLVSRGCCQRGSRDARVRPPVRAPDVRRDGDTRQTGLLGPSPCLRRVQQRLHRLGRDGLQVRYPAGRPCARCSRWRPTA